MRNKFTNALTILILFGFMIAPVGRASAQEPGSLEKKFPITRTQFRPAGNAGPTLLSATNIVADPSFEASYNSTASWNQFSTNFTTPLCIVADCGNGNGTAGPRTGSVWVWFGGVDFSEPGITSPEIADVYQNITFPNTSCGATLQFYLWIGAATSGSDANDLFVAAIDGTAVFSANATQQSSYPSYKLVSVNVGAYANGGVHQVEFYSNTSNQLVTFNLDDVSLVAGNCAISGNTNVGDVSLSYNDGGSKTATSLSNGTYSLLASNGWTGTVTPSHACFTFTPSSRNYNNVTTNQTSQNYTPAFNPASGCADINVRVGGANQGRFGILPHGSTRASFAGLNDGPVKIASTNAISLIGAERVIYKVNNVNTSFSEMMGLPDGQLAHTYWLPWYNNVDLDTQLRIGNVSGSAATVHIFIGTNEVTPPTGISLPAGASTRVSYTGVNDGPVKIQSDQNIVAAERVIYKVSGKNTSFSEMMALPNSQLDTTYWLPWYNNVDLDTQLRIGNVTGSAATVHIFIGTNEVTPPTGISLPAGASTRLSYTGVNNGPVKIQSDQNIVAAERVIYKVNNTPTSFTETMALPDSQLNTLYWLPWYNNMDLDTQLRIGNVSNNAATVHVFIGGTEVTPVSGISLAVGESTRVSYVGVNNGPVEIQSNQNIVAAERIIYKVSGVNTSFSEMMALPNSQLNATYWLPWYNNADLDTQLRFGVP